MTAAAALPRPARSVFTGADVCSLAGLSLPDGSARPMSDDQMRDFTDVTGLPAQMQPAHRRFDFTPILDPRWQLVARELIMALLAPRHEAVAPLPRAYRTPLHLNTVRGRLSELTRWLNWLTGRQITSLCQVDDDTCQAYLAERRQICDEHGTVTGDHGPATRRAAAQVVVDLLNYGELLTADRPDPWLRPWGGASASAVAEMRCGREGNTTPPVDDSVLQPMLAAALYLVTTLGPHVAVLHEQIRQAGKVRSRTPRPPGTRARPAAGLAAELDRHRRSGEPLPELDHASQQDRILHRWDPSDPLLTVNLDAIARQAGFVQFEARWLPPLRDDIHATLRAAGTDPPWARAATRVARADGQGSLPWTVPVHRFEADALIGITRTATTVLTAAVSGMRSSELMELRIGCRRPAGEYAPGLVRYRLASRVVKASRWAAPMMNGSSSNRSSRRSGWPGNSIPAPATGRCCSAASHSPSATAGSGTG